MDKIPHNYASVLDDFKCSYNFDKNRETMEFFLGEKKNCLIN